MTPNRSIRNRRRLPKGGGNGTETLHGTSGDPRVDITGEDPNS